MPTTSQILKPQTDEIITQVDETVTHVDNAVAQVDETAKRVSVSRPRVPQNSSAVQAESGTDNSLRHVQGLPQGQDTNLSQDTEALSSAPSASEALSLKVLLDEDKPDTPTTQPTPEAQLSHSTTISPGTQTITRNLGRYMRENPAQTLCGLTITSLLTIVAILLGSSLTSTNARFAEVNNTMDNRFAEVNTRFNEMNTSIDNRFAEVNNTMNARFAEVNTRFNAIDSKFDAINDKFDAINDKFDAINNKFDDVNDNFNDINVQLAKLITALNLDTTN